MSTIMGIDPGSESSGVIIFTNGAIDKGDNIPNESLFTMIDQYANFGKKGKLFVVYEDIRPFTSRFNMETINTCKMIGRLEYVLKQQRIGYMAITRNEVKHYVFNTFRASAVAEIEKRILKSGKTKKDGTALTPSFVFVNDKIIQRSMALLYSIERPKPGKREPRGIRLHVWQALACVACYFDKEEKLMAGSSL